ncbi:MAG TPA: molybdopterin cofactor-binding domain-containing protein, partial [Rhodospirillales bacterium]|nr:molybdopterin cofactor-binding domain-containing protein [Rhodospirillales bacterium]
MPTNHGDDPVVRAGHPSRRRFLAASAALGAGLTIGFALPRGPATAAPEQRKPNPFEAYLRIAPDGAVTVYSAHMDMGQGCYTGIATLVAEELDADWSAVRVEGAAGNPGLYGNMAWGGKVQGTGGSTAMASSFDRYRQAGAAARVMLVAAAAEEWRLPADEIRVANGVLSHPSGRRATFGELAVAAARQPVPQDPPLKQPGQWTKIGSESLRRLDSAGKVNGSEQYTCDVRLPGMLSAVIAHPPLFGATVRSFDAGKAKAVPGVVDVVQTSRGIVVLAGPLQRDRRPPVDRLRRLHRLDDDVAIGHGAPAEAAAGLHHVQAHLVVRHAGDLRRDRLIGIGNLEAAPHLDPVAGSGDHRVQRFQRGVRQVGKGVGGFDDAARGADLRRRVAAPAGGVFARQSGQPQVFGQDLGRTALLGAAVV